MVTDVWTNQKPRGWTFISVFIMLLIKLQAHFSTALTRDVTKLSRIFVADSLQLDAPYQIDEKNCHYITSVMRLKVGSSFRIFNGRDGEFLCDLQSIAKNKKSAQGVLSRQIRSQTEDRRLPIILYCASLKKPRMKLLLEKVTELGVQDIVLVKTQNSNADYEDEDALASLERVCIESAEQCERLSVPRVLRPIPFQQLSSHWQGLSTSSSDQQSDTASARLLVCRERFPGGEPLLQVLLSHLKVKGASTELLSTATNQPTLPLPLGLFVGPEGGFTSAELEGMAELNKTFHFVTLGDSVLRAETAAISAVCTAGAALDFITYSK